MKNLVGKILIAPPSVKGSFWQKTVILITESHEQGNMGLVLNKPTKVSIKDFAQQNSTVLNEKGFVHIGGPVQSKALTLLHSAEWKCSNTMKITSDLAISSSPDILSMMAMGHKPKQWRMFVGLCSWTKGQLYNEINGIPPYTKNHSWLTATPNFDLLFDHDTQSQWTESIEQSGLEFAQKFFA
jgi:putative transcriptional regulator